MIRTCWELGELPEFAHLKLRKWAHMLSFPGHFSTKSRSYSTTLGALRDARRSWRTEQARAHADLPDLDPTTTLVVGHWNYLGSGYSPGGALLAAHIWLRKELERQFAPTGAVDDLATARCPPRGVGTGSGSAHGAPGDGPPPVQSLRRLRPAPLRPTHLDRPRPRPPHPHPRPHRLHPHPPGTGSRLMTTARPAPLRPAAPAPVRTATGPSTSARTAAGKPPDTSSPPATPANASTSTAPPARKPWPSSPRRSPTATAASPCPPRRAAWLRT